MHSVYKKKQLRSYDFRESTAYKTVRWIKDTLIKHRDFTLPSGKVRLKNEVEYDIVLIYATENQLKSQKMQKHFYLGKKKRRML